MSKPQVNTLIKKLTLSGQTTKVTPWMVEGNARDEEVAIRYVGVKPDGSWEGVFSSQDNLLVKFTIVNKRTSMSILFANKPPFIELGYTELRVGDTWEHVFGTIKQRLKREAIEFKQGKAQVGSLYAKLKPQVKKL